MKLGQYRGVLFDFDGTLTKPFFDWMRMRDEMGFESDIDILDYLSKAEGTERSRVKEVLFRHEAAASEGAELGEGVQSVLGFLNSRSVPVGIVTNNTYANVEPVLERFGLEFRVVVTRDIGVWKPDPRQVEVGCRALGFPASQVIFIGDGRYDMMAGRKAGTLNIGLLNTTQQRTEFIRLCDHAIEDLRGAIPLLEGLLAKV